MLFKDSSISHQLIDFYCLRELGDTSFSLILPTNLIPGFQKTDCRSFPKSNPLKQPKNLYLDVTSHVFECFGQCPKMLSMEVGWSEVESHHCSSCRDGHSGPRSGETGLLYTRNASSSYGLDCWFLANTEWINRCLNEDSFNKWYQILQFP